MPVGEITNINFIGFIFLFLMSILTFFLPRRVVSIPIIATTCYITLGQSIVIAGLNFFSIRLIILAGIVRVIMRKEYDGLRINNIDKALIWWVMVAIVTHTILYGTKDAFINRMGYAYNAFGLYFLFRIFIRDSEDVKRVIKIISIIIIPLAVSMLYEKATGRNVFHVFGGVPEFTATRNGQLRCQGPFSHPILAGTFGASIMPLCLARWFESKTDRAWIALGFISSTMITFLSGSTGPVIAYVVGIFGWLMWKFRELLLKNIKMLLWSGVASLIILDLLIMKARVWFLIDRLSDAAGAGGHAYYRAKLIDEAVRHIDEWWLIGVKYTAHWDLVVLEKYPDKVDITNQYIKQGVDGGLITMILFIVIIVCSFRALFKMMRSSERSSKEEIIAWGLSVALLSHVASFFSIVYFDQMVVLWYLLLAMISATILHPIKSDHEKAAKATGLAVREQTSVI